MMILAILTILGFSFMAFADEPTGGGDAGGDTNTDSTSDSGSEVSADGSGEDVDGLSLDSENTATIDEPVDDDIVPSADSTDTETTKEVKEPEPAKEPESKDTSKPDAQSQVFEPEFVNKAKALGFTEAEVKAFGSPERFIGVVGSIIDKYKASQAQKEPEKKVDGQASPETKTDPVQGEDDFNLDSDDYDPEFKKMGGVVKTLRNQNAELMNRLKAIEERTNSEFTSIAEERRSQFEKWYDTEMDTLGNDHPDLFGKDSESSKANRDVLIEDMAIMAKGYQSLGKPVPDKAELLKRVVQSRFGDQLTTKEKTKALDEVKAEVEARKKGAINRPNGKHNSTIANPDKEARDYLKSELRSLGVKVYDDEEDDTSGLAL